MQRNKAVSLSGKAGDVTSINDGVPTESTIDLPPAEAFLSEVQVSDDGISTRRELAKLVWQMMRSLSAQPIFAIVGLIISVLIFSVVGEIRMNRWQGDFYRAIEQKNIADLGHHALLFLAIMSVLLAFVVSQNWLLEHFKIRFRRWLTHRLLDLWMRPGAAYRLAMTSEERLHPEQRIQEDVRHFAELTADLGVGALRATLMLISFVGILWALSEGIILNLGDTSFEIPGYMVWFAMIYAGIGSWFAARVGSPLVRLNEQRYTHEASFRYSLVRVGDNAESISFYSGEKDERRTIEDDFKKVLSTMGRLAFANAKLTWIACGHGWLVVILPVLVALPGYMQGRLDFGGLMMVVGAFNQVQQSLRWFVERFGQIADWQASFHRVLIFRDAVDTVDEYENHPKMITLYPHPQGFLEFDKTCVSLMDGEVVIADATATIEPGEKVLITGESGSGKSTLLRAVGGLWPWGFGTIRHPPKSEMMFLPQRPYIPLGTLANAIGYPNAARDWDEEELKRCLIRVNLGSFISMLHESARWDKLMSLGQQQRLAFARVLLHRPRWVFLDEATSALDDENQARVMSLFTEELASSALLSIGHRHGLELYHNRTLHLIQTHSGRVLIKKPKPSIQNEPKRKTGLNGENSIDLFMEGPTAIT